jgi:hypothetical protein
MTWVDQHFVSSAADWSALNGSANTTWDVTDDHVMVRWDSAANGGGKLSGIKIPIGASSNWVRIFKINGVASYTDGEAFGVGLFDSIGGKAVGIMLFPGDLFTSAQAKVVSIPATLDSTSVIGSSKLNPDAGVNGTHMVRYFKIKHDGTNLRWYWSEDGVTFTQLLFETPTTHFDNNPDTLWIGLFQKSGPMVVAVDYVIDAEDNSGVSGGGSGAILPLEGF